MTKNTPVQTLPYWLDKAQNKVDYILSSGKKSSGKEKLRGFYEFNKIIKLDISHRGSCFRFYNQIINAEDKYFKPSDLDKYEIKVNDEWFRYHEIRYQLFIPFLSINTRIYETCIRLYYFLYNPEKPQIFYRLSDVLSNRFIKNLKEKEYSTVLKSLSYEYGYCLSIILFFRNRFIHNEQLLNEKRDFFLSNNGKDKDILNLEAIEDAHNEYITKKVRAPLSKEYFNLSEKIENKAGIIAEQCAYISDHYMGYLINSILDKRWFD